MQESLRQQYLTAMGIPIWLPRQLTEPSSAETSLMANSNATAELTHQTSQDTIQLLSWEDLQTRVSACQLCSLAKTRQHTVFGMGNPQAKLVIVGEAPGATEDQQGLPFVGRAGKLLDAMLQAINLQRSEIFITNILKCRPPNNRDPDPQEVACCTPYLERQLQLLQPRLLLALGRIAAHFLLNSTTTLSRLRGQQFHYGTQRIPLLVTYHPAYLLRSPQDKDKAYQDLLLVRSLLQ